VLCRINLKTQKASKLYETLITKMEEERPNAMEMAAQETERGKKKKKA